MLHQRQDSGVRWHGRITQETHKRKEYLHTGLVTSCPVLYTAGKNQRSIPARIDTQGQWNGGRLRLGQDWGRTLLWGEVLPSTARLTLQLLQIYTVNDNAKFLIWQWFWEKGKINLAVCGDVFPSSSGEADRGLWTQLCPAVALSSLAPILPFPFLSARGPSSVAHP